MSKHTETTYRAPFYKRQALRFTCTGCGHCCTGSDEYHVFLSKKESEKIRNFLGLSQSWFQRRYLVRLSDDELVLSADDDGNCVFLDEQGACRIYPVRPQQCSSYPFWPEVVLSSRGWHREARRCEGIGNGSVVSVKIIEDALRKSGSL